MKQNDWIIALLNNPTFDVGDFLNILDMNLSNTLLLDKETYLKSQKVRSNKVFLNDNGEFSEDKFTDFYNKASKAFLTFSSENNIDNYKYSMWDITRPAGSKVKNPNFLLSTEINPSHTKVGIAGIDEVSDPDKSAREYALNSKIFDTKSGLFLDKTVNDISLFKNPLEYFKSLAGDPLVYATYSEDIEEIDLFTGRPVKHKKGEYKVNNLGEYYTETLGGRSLIGKEVVSSLDYLTPENSALNKYDFFDSDELDKSVGGVIMKNVAALVPLAIPIVDVAYSGFLVSREISKSLPMLYGMITGLTGKEETESKLLNNIAAYGLKFTSSTSDYARNHIFSFENIGNLISDVATLWELQLFIASGFTKLTSGGKKALETAQFKALLKYADETLNAYINYVTKGIEKEKLLGYTGLSSEQEAIKLLGEIRTGNITSDIIKTGAWKETPFGKAAWNLYVPKAQKVFENRTKLGLDMSLAYMAIISNTGVYDSVLQKGGTPFEAAAIALGSTLGMFSVDKYLGLGRMFFQDPPIRTALRNSAKNAVKDINSGLGVTTSVTTAEARKGFLGLVERGIAAGKKAVNNLDVSKLKGMGIVGKSLGEGLEEVSEELVADMSKLLGEIAGLLGYFSQKDYGAWDNAFERYAMSMLGGALGGGIYGAKHAWQTRNDVQEFKDDMMYLIRQGRKDDIIKELTSLRDKGEIASTELSLNKDENGTYLTAENSKESLNELIYNKLILIVNLLDLILNDNQIKLSDDDLFDNMVQGEFRLKTLTDFLKKDNKEISYITKYYDDFNALANKITSKLLEINNKLASVTDPSKRTKEFLDLLEELESLKEELLKQRDELFGEGSLGYVKKLQFALDLPLSNLYLNLTFDLFVKSKGKLVSELTTQEKSEYLKLFKEYSKNKKDALDIAFNAFEQIEAILNPEVLKLSNLDLKLLNEILDRYKKYKTEYNSLLYTKEDGETDEDFSNRVINKRLELIKELLTKPITSNIRRDIFESLNSLKNEHINYLLDTNVTGYNLETILLIKDAFKLYLKDKDRDNLVKAVKEIINKPLLLDRNKKYLEILDEDNSESSWDAMDIILDILSEIPSLGSYITSEDIILWVNTLKTKLAEQISAIEGRAVSLDEVSILSVFDNLKANNPNWANDRSLVVIDNIILKITEVYTKGEASDEFVLPSYDEDGILLFGEVTELFVNNDVYELIANELDNNVILLTISEVEKGVITNNPVIPLINFIAEAVRGSKVKTEDLLNDIYETFSNLDYIEDFELSPALLKALEDTIKDLNLAANFIYAASKNPSYRRPFGHNKSINLFVENHKDVFKNFLKLPEIEEESGYFLINEIGSYISEISNWINRHKRNQENRGKRFENAEKALLSSLLLFFKDSTFEVDGFDLLTGKESINDADSDLVKVIKYHTLLNKNYKALKAKGLKDSYIIEKLFSNGILNNKSLINLEVAKLDEHLKYGDLTDYDKFLLIISSLAISDINYYDNLLNYIENNKEHGSIAILEHVARILYAQQRNPHLVNEALKWLKGITKSKLDIVFNSTIITGSAGAGKSSGVSAVTTNGGVNTLVTGPTLDLSNNLQRNLPKAQVVNNYVELVYEAIGKEKGNKLIELSKDLEAKNTEFYTVIDDTIGDKTVHLKISNDAINTSGSRTIIIDEATHIPTTVLLLLGKWALKNDISLLFLGDSNLNGFEIRNKMNNLEPQSVIAWRTPKLHISLRDNNVLKVHNLSLLNENIDIVSSGKTVDLVVAKSKSVFDSLKTSYLSYYIEDTFSGEYITDTLEPELIKKLSGKIAVISDELGSSYYKQLKDAGKDVVEILPLNVQGSEYDYVIINTKFLNPLDSKLSDFKKGVTLQEFLKNLYTMISRSKSGSIITDTSIKNLINNRLEFSTGKFNITLLVEKSRKDRIGNLKQALTTIKTWESSLTLEEPNIELETPTEEKPIEEPTTEEGTQELITEEEIEEILEEEKVPENNTEELKKKQTETEEDDYLDAVLGSAIDTSIVPVRVYGNVTYSGIDTKGDTWTNEEGITLDLGIFLKKGLSVTSADDKRELVGKLYKLKSLFLFGTGFDDNWYKQSPEIKEIFDLDTIKNAEYHILIEDSSDYNRLIGLTTLSNDEKKKLINGKVVKLVAKLKGKDGIVYTVSLGGLANPATWSKNQESIIKAIETRIANGETELQDYLNNLNLYINQYIELIQELTSGEYDKLLKQSINGREIWSYRINKPKFSGMTDLVNGEFRLEDINSNHSEFDNHTKYAVVSNIYTETGVITGEESEEELLEKLNKGAVRGINPYLVGKPIMYVSSNPFLTSGELRERYLHQKTHPEEGVRDVRIILLDSAGVSFESLRRPNYVNEIYRRVRGDSEFLFPFDSKRVTPKMYISMWNFRANLSKFINAYEEAFTGIGEDSIISALKKDNEWYNKHNKEFKEANGNTKENLSEEEYRKIVETNYSADKDFELILKIYKFNDSLGNVVRQFRLGHNSKHGAYLRKLTNLDSTFYGNNSSVIGIYITPNMARNYLYFSNKLFEHIVNKIITPFSDNIETYIDTNIAKSNKNWFNDLYKTGNLDVTISEDGSKNTIHINGRALEGFPIVLVKLSKFLEAKDFLSNEELSKDKFDLIYKDKDDKEIGLDWNLVSFQDSYTPISNDDYKEEDNLHIEGVFKDSDGYYYDHRYDDFFSLMFHGVFSISDLKVKDKSGKEITISRKNNFETDDIRATDAIFKYGIFSSAFLAKYKNGVQTHLIETNRKLFKTDKIPGLPRAEISLLPYLEELMEEEPITVTPTTVLENTISKVVEDFNKLLSTLGLDNLTESLIERINNSNNAEETIKEINREICKEYFDNIPSLKNIQYLYIDNNWVHLDSYIENNFGLFESKKVLGKVIKYSFSNGNSVTVLYRGKELVVTSQLDRTKPDTTKVGEVVNNILSLISELEQETQDLVKEDIDKLRLNLEEPMALGAIKVKNIIDNIFEDESVSLSVKEKIRDEINNLVNKIDKC